MEPRQLSARRDRVGMYERYHEPLISRRAFLIRTAQHGVTGVALLALSLLIGVLGYWHFAHLSWVDALLNASMILGGMGPVAELHTNAAKIFASAYALFSGVIFLVSAGILLAPGMHRLLHHFHISSGQD